MTDQEGAAADSTSGASRGAAAVRRYGQIMRDFMAYTFRDGMKYVEAEDHVFTDEELGAVLPEHIVRFFKYKLYGDGDIDETKKSVKGSHHTIGKPMPGCCDANMLCYVLISFISESNTSIIILTSSLQYLIFHSYHVHRLLQKGNLLLHAQPRTAME